MRGIRLREFLHDGAAAARLGATARDKLLLWACQVAGSLRYRRPSLVAGVRVEPRIRRNGRTLATPIRFCADDWMAFRQVFVEEEYGWETGCPARVVDAGSNCGFMALEFAARHAGAEIACVEPHPELADLTRGLLARHGLNCTVVEAALGPADRRARLHLGRMSTTHSLRSRGPLVGKGSIEVDCISFPSLLARLGWDGVDLLKLDIEGAESDLLARSPLWLRRVGMIVGEIHGAYGPRELQADLEPAGFHVESRPVRTNSVFLAVRDGAAEIAA